MIRFWSSYRRKGVWMTMKRGKPTIVLDFDGVIHSYKSGWKGPDVIPDPPVEGIKAAIEKLRKTYRLVVVSSRCLHDEGIDAIRQWLQTYDITVDDVTGQKQPGVVYVDDRAITFDGHADLLYEKIKAFKPWHKK